MAKAPTDIRSLARAHTATAIKTLAGIMEQPTAPEAARVSAANALLDRGWGKPTQPVSAATDPLAEIETDELRQMLDAVRELAAGRGGAPNGIGSPRPPGETSH